MIPPQQLAFFSDRKTTRYWPVTVKKLSGKTMDQTSLLISLPLPDSCRVTYIESLEDWTMHTKSHAGKSDRSWSTEMQLDSAVVITGKIPTHPDSQPKKSHCWRLKSTFSWSWFNLTILTSYRPVNTGTQYNTCCIPAWCSHPSGVHIFTLLSFTQCLYLTF